MAGIQQKTKGSNTFRFKSFADRVAEIDLRRRALYHIGHENEELPEDNETYFHQTLKKWTVLNLSDEFGAFSRKCLKIVTLPQLIHQKDFLVDLLLEHLATATNLSLQPLLELLYVLARDLREQFYAYFQRVLDRLICLLNTEDADQLEWTLVCLAHLFKTLKPHLKRNIGVIFNSILPLLDEQCYEEHVTNFAVECFSFIARDIKDFGKFLDFILETVEREQVESVQGCGRLFFEIVRGTQGLFHSVADEFLRLLFEALLDERRTNNEQLELLSSIVSQTLDNILSYIEVQNIGVLWLNLCMVANDTTSTERLPRLLALFIQATQYRDGRYVCELDTIVDSIFKMIASCNECNAIEALESLGVLVSKLVLAKAGEPAKTPLLGHRLLPRMLGIKHRKIAEQFMLLVTDHSSFDLQVLPCAISNFESYFDVQAFELLAQIVLHKQPLALNAAGLKHWQRYDLPLKINETLKKLGDKLRQFDLKNEEAMEENILILLVLPHLPGLDASLLQQVLLKSCKEVMKQLDAKSYFKPQEPPLRLIVILALLIETLIHLKIKTTTKVQQQLLQALLPYTHNLRALGAIDQLLSTTKSEFETDQVTVLTESLSTLLGSHNRDLRLTAAHALQTLQTSKSKQAANPYKIFYNAESVELNVHSYRDQLLLIQKLETTSEFFKTMKNERFQQDTLRFLLGMLYHNFKFVWEPVLKLIEAYAKVMPLQDFWNIYKLKLVETTKFIDKSYEIAEEPIISSEDLWQNETLNNLVTDCAVPKLTQKELLNYRNLLWMRLPQFGQLTEIKNAELVSMFLKFVQEEYRKNLENHEFIWNLKEQAAAKLLTQDDDDENEEGDAAENEHKQRRTPKKAKRRSKNQMNAMAKAILQTLESKIGIFVHQPNPKALHREPELQALWLDLLSGPNAQLQKLALDCLLSYKNKAHTSYKEQLYTLIDEKKFRDALINFKLDDAVATEHRPDLMPILLRILYGKMITKGTQRSISAQVRKGLILRFLGQCSTDEILWFLHMAFGRYEHFVNATRSVEEVPDMVRKNFDLSAIWSPKKLQSIVNLLELIRKEFGGLMDNQFQLYMLKLLIFVGSICNEVLQQHEADATQMHPKMPIVFKNVRNAALQSLVNFFAHIEEFPWLESQIACITKVFIWPSIERLAVESIHTPTGLMKLLLQWGEKTQHFKFLQQKHPSQEHVIFHYLIALLLNEKAKPAVRKPIMGLIERLLVTTAGETVSNEGACALALIKPFIPQLLKRLKMNFNTRSAKQSLDKRDLNILSLLTAHVEEAETCDSLLQLLLPILITKTQTHASEEVVCQVITTLANLIKRLDAPETYLLKIAPLFEQVQEVQARKLLCQLIADIAKLHLKQKLRSISSQEQCMRLKNIARLMLMLNAWDKRWVEQPDYDKRLDALKEITDLLKANSVDMDLGVLVIYNCFYFIKYDKDLGLRDNASEHLRFLVPQLVQRYMADKPQLDFLINDVLLNLLRRLIRDGNDNVRNEGIKLLGVCARDCATAHDIFSDLSLLADRHDVEVDFFENMIHLQSHRHGRALLKFCSTAETLTKLPNVRTLTQFILPLAQRYLLNEKHAGKHTLIDAAIETVGVVCQLLPWQHYHTILRYYLMKMRTIHEHQKHCVRIVVRILDAFHYDLSQSKTDTETLQKLKEELKKKVSEDVEPKVEQVKEKSSKKTDTDEEDNGDGDDKTNDGKTAAVEDEENLELDLEKASNASDTEEEQKSATIPKQSIMKTPVLLAPAASRRVMATIATILIPTLNRSITEKSSYDVKHKVNRKRFSAEREEEEILRVPIALALVKLMQKLPKELLDTSLPGVFMKVCTFLRSPLKSVRMLTRDILKKIMLTLGASYLALLMDHLQTLLTRGFQVHVLSVTVHGVLDALRDQLQPIDLESCLSNLLEVALNDIFGEITAEKEVEKIAAHTPEAKPSAKSYLVLHIAARNIRENCLLDLLMPFKEHLVRSHSRKLVLKIQDCFAKIVSGLVENPHISRESLLIFIYGTMSESIVDLLPGTQKRQLSEQEKEKMRRARPDCYIIQPAPQRARVGVINKTIKTNAQANAHILIEFGLEMLHIVLKRKKLLEVDYQPFLNPILPLLRDSLKSTHIRVTTFALKCFTTIWNDEYELPTLQGELTAVVERLFEILKNFSTFGATKQEDNQQLVKSTYKAIVALLRKCTNYTLTDAQIDQLVLYVEQDIYEGENQVMCFSLLKAMLARKVNTPPIHDIMKKLSDLSIVSPSDFVRDEARGMLITYLMEYPLNKRVDQILKYFTVQLCYKLPTGRQSAINFLQLVIKKFPLNILSKRAEFLYLSLGTRLVNDEDPGCRKAVAECIEKLIMRIQREDRQRLFDITLLFFSKKASKPSMREMAAALCSRFLNAEQKSFAPRIKLILPTLMARLTLSNPSAPGRFVRASSGASGLDVNGKKEKYFKRKKFHNATKFPAKQLEAELLLDENSTSESVAQEQRAIDHEIIQMQYCLLKIFEYCSADLFANKDLYNSIDELAYESQRLLAHEHAWVRTNAAKIIALILGSYDFDHVGNKLRRIEDKSSDGVERLDFVYLSPEYDIKSLVLDLCAQFVPGETTQVMIDEIVKIFLYIANMLRNVPFVTKQELEHDKEADLAENVNDTQQTKINLNWLVRNIRFLINKEVAKTPHCITMRSALFTLIEGLITLLSVESLKKLAPALLASLVREMSEDDQNVEADLRQQALRVGSKLRKRIGSDIYDKLRSGAQTKLMVRRAERRKLVAQEKIHDPVKAAKRKIGVQDRKKASKKRRTDVWRGKAEDVKQKLKKRKRKAEEDIF